MLSAEILRILFGFVAVLGLIALSALAARKFGLVAATGGLSRKRRLSVVETLAIDARRRAVIVKCDGKEHLILLGATGETVVDSDIETPAVAEEVSSENPFSLAMAKTQASETQNAA